MNNLKKIAWKVVVEGVACVALTSGFAVISTFATKGSDGVKKLDLNALLDK